jgi:transcriptional regulator with XRE-family HTH domain
MNVTAGQRLREWRKAQGLTQREVADLVGEDQSTISRLEKGALTPTLACAIELSKLARGRGGRLRLPVDMWSLEERKTA